LKGLPHIRVVKVGGSLLDLPGLAGRLRDWFARQPPARSVVVVGGGPLADAIRSLDQLHHLGDEVCHQFAVQAMTLAARLLHAMIGEWKLIAQINDLDRTAEAPVLLDPWQYLHAEESSLAAPPLPHSWAVTSDSIAARLARQLAAGELVLLKSRLPPGSSLAAVCDAGYVDSYFFTAAHGLCIRCVNLRETGYPEQYLHDDGRK
jgi:aspartokinase-like uncharacterized kinase